jgi:hypothetical protein
MVTVPLTVLIIIRVLRCVGLKVLILKCLPLTLK